MKRAIRVLALFLLLGVTSAAPALAQYRGGDPPPTCNPLTDPNCHLPPRS